LRFLARSLNRAAALCREPVLSHLATTGKQMSGTAQVDLRGCGSPSQLHNVRTIFPPACSGPECGKPYSTLCRFRRLFHSQAT
jgi:hypothetical protein